MWNVGDMEIKEELLGRWKGELEKEIIIEGVSMVKVHFKGMEMSQENTVVCTANKNENEKYHISLCTI